MHVILTLEKVLQLPEHHNGFTIKKINSYIKCRCPLRCARAALSRLMMAFPASALVYLSVGFAPTRGMTPARQQINLHVHITPT